MRTGFVIDQAHWDTVIQGLPEGLVSIEWASHDAGECLDFLALGDIGLVIVEARADLLTPEVIAVADRAGIVLAALITGPTGDDVATSQGVGHRLRQPEDLAVLISHLEHSGGETDTTNDLAPASPRGWVRVFYGPHGAPGVTTLCLTQASVLAREGLRVAVVDADARGGVVAMALGLTNEIPGFLAALRRAGKSALSPDEVDRLGDHYDVPPVRYTVFSSTPRPLIRGEATRDDIDVFLDVARAHFDAVIIDAGSGGIEPVRPDHTPGAGHDVAAHLLWRADDVVMVCGASLPGVARFCRALDDVKDHAGSTPLRMWLNALDTSRRAHGGDGALREALWRYGAMSDYAVIPRDDASARQALRQALSIPEAQPSSPIVAAVLDQSQGLIDHASAQTVRAESADGATATSISADRSQSAGRRWGTVWGWGKKPTGGRPGWWGRLVKKWHQLTALR